MSRARLMLVSAMSAVAAFAMFASSASARIKFEWFVEGKLLGAGELRSFTTTTDGKTFDFKASLSGAAVLLLSNKVSVSNAMIVGGVPGTNLETVIFENVVVDKPAGCVAETGGIANPTPGIIETKPLLSQIVEGQLSKEPLGLVRPEGSNIFTEIKLLDAAGQECVGAGTTAAVEGSILGESLPSLVETLQGDIDVEPSHNLFLLASGGAVETAGLTFAGNAAFLTGLVLDILTTDEKYGAF